MGKIRTEKGKRQVSFSTAVFPQRKIISHPNTEQPMSGHGKQRPRKCRFIAAKNRVRHINHILRPGKAERNKYAVYNPVKRLIEVAVAPYKKKQKQKLHSLLHPRRAEKSRVKTVFPRAETVPLKSCRGRTPPPLYKAQREPQKQHFPRLLFIFVLDIKEK